MGAGGAICRRQYGPSSTIYNRFVRWAQRGVWENLFNASAARGRSTHTQMIDSTHVMAHRSASGGKGGEQNQAVDRSRGGRNTKIHAVTDAKGRLLTFVLTGGEAHDCPVGAELIEASPPAELLLADKGYDSADLLGAKGSIFTAQGKRLTDIMAITERFNAIDEVLSTGASKYETIFPRTDGGEVLPEQ